MQLSNNLNKKSAIQFQHLQVIKTILLNFSLLDIKNDNGERVLPLASFLVASRLILHGSYSDAIEILSNGLCGVKNQQVRFSLYILRSWCFAFTDDRSISSPNEVVQTEVKEIDSRLNRVQIKRECVAILKTSSLLEASTAEECVYSGEIFICLAFLLTDNLSESWGVYLRIGLEGVSTAHLDLYKQLGALLWKSDQNIVRSNKAQRPRDVRLINLSPLGSGEWLKREPTVTIRLSHTGSGSLSYTATDSAGGTRKSSVVKSRQAELPLPINTRVTIWEIKDSEFRFTLLRDRLLKSHFKPKQREF